MSLNTSHDYIHEVVQLQGQWCLVRPMCKSHSATSLDTELVSVFNKDTITIHFVLEFLDLKAKCFDWHRKGWILHGPLSLVWDLKHFHLANYWLSPPAAFDNSTQSANHFTKASGSTSVVSRPLEWQTWQRGTIINYYVIAL